MVSPGYILEMKLHGIHIDVFFWHIVQTAGIRHSSNPLCDDYHLMMLYGHISSAAEAQV